MRLYVLRSPFSILVTIMFNLSVVWPAESQIGTTHDEVIASSNNYDKAEFRLWYPDSLEQIRAIVLLVPGSHGDGRPAVGDSTWQAFATRHGLALLGCYYADKPHDQMFIEEYVNVSQGSGQALYDALTLLARRSGHPEIATAPLLLWGISAGGQFNYEFVAWKPERVVGFVVNKGGIYYSALLSRAARSVPGIFFVGENDMASRTNAIIGLFELNRRCGALWALAMEPGTGHTVGRSRDMAMIFFEELLPLRLPAASSEHEQNVLRPVSEASGFLGHLKDRTIQKQDDDKPPTYPSAWLPSERVARAWKALVTEKPFDP